MSADWFFQYSEGLAMCWGSGVLALVQPKIFLNLLAHPNESSKPQHELTVYMTQLYGITAMGFGMMLYHAIPEMKPSTKNKVLGALLLGDCLQIYLALTHENVFGGFNTKEALSE